MGTGRKEKLQGSTTGSAIGAVLSQEKDGMDLPVAYMSRVLVGPELNYSTMEKECLTVLYAVNQFRPYIYGRKFTPVRDHETDYKEDRSSEETEKDQEPPPILRKRKSVLPSLNLPPAAYPSSTTPKSAPAKKLECLTEFFPEVQQKKNRKRIKWNTKNLSLLKKT